MNTPKKKKNRIYTMLSGITFLVFLGCAAYLIFYLGIQPYYLKQQSKKINAAYYNSSEFDSGNKNSDGLLLKFSELLKTNKDTKGWLRIPGTNIDYPVVQGEKNSDFYLHHNLKGDTDKNGCLYIDANCNVETPTKNIVIHGHNMESTRMMFFQLPKYKDMEFYKKHPILVFDSIYDESKWKIISFMRVSGTYSHNDGFDYMQGEFNDNEEFLDFLHQVEMRSLYQCPVTVNEKDSLLMLSTCTYEIDNCRSVVVARKLRKGESEDVNTSKAYLKNDVLYPDDWYSKYGGKMPVANSFTEAISEHTLDWYDGKRKH